MGHTKGFAFSDFVAACAVIVLPENGTWLLLAH